MGKPGHQLPEYVNQDERRQHVARLYLQGHTMQVVAERLGITRPTVCRDIAKVREQWKTSTIRDYNEHLNRELSRLDAIEAAAWLGWERSLDDRRLVHEESEGDPQDEVNLSGNTETQRPGVHTVTWIRRRLKTRVEGQSGNPAFLQVVLECVEKRIKLLALNEVQQAAGIEGTSLTPDQEAAAMDATVPAGPAMELDTLNGEGAGS